MPVLRDVDQGRPAGTQVTAGGAEEGAVSGEEDVRYYEQESDDSEAHPDAQQRCTSPSYIDRDGMKANGSSWRQ